MQGWDDDQLIRAIRQGGLQRDKALDYLDEKLRRILHHILIEKYSLHDCIREELVNDTFTKLWKSINDGQFRADSSIKTYAIVILNSIAIGYFNSRRGKEDKKTSGLSDEQQNTMSTETHAIDTNSNYDDQLYLALESFRLKEPEHYANISLITNCELSSKDLTAMLGKKSDGATRQYLTELRKKMRIYIEEFCNKQEK